MDNRTLRSKRSRPRSAGPYDRQNQSILGKVCSTVKGLLNPSSWFNVSQWYGNSEEETPGCSTSVEDTVRDDNDIVSKSVSHGSKRLRLRVEDHIPSIQSSATQTWSEQPSTPNLYEPSVSHVPSSTTQNTLLDNKEPLPVLNGDDHSENSEGSASTSGCSSLVSSHKDNRLVDSPFQNIRSDMRSSRNRREANTSKSGDLNSSRSLWSSNFSPSAKFQRRLPTISNTNQPNFNLSSFVGPSKFNQSVEKKVLSPFYEGKTTFGGASAVRRMPSSVAPYQVEKTLRNQIKVREQHSEDNLEGMSSAAKRILLTLEKMSSPVIDAKKMPNTSTSPVDLSLYLTPPKSRRNAQFTPSIPSKGPPIANITTIAKLANLKNYGVNRLRNTMLSSPVLPAEQANTNLDVIQPSTSEADTSKGGGGKMRNKLNQHHQSKTVENEMLEEPTLPNIPLPISKLPIISFGPKPEKKLDNFLSSKGFTFSNPIQPDLSISNAVVTSPRTLSTSSYDSKIETNSDLQLKPFVFSSPIEHELPSNRILPTENTSLPTCNTSNSDIRMTSTSKDSGFLPKVNTTIPMNSTANSDAKASSTWECTECWIRNPSSRTTCMGCKPSQVPKKDSSSVAGFFKFNNIEKPQQGSSSVSASCTGFLHGSPQTNIESVSSRPLSQPLSHGSGSNNSPSIWECSVCWVRNPEKPSKCIACGVPRYQNEKLEIKSPASSSSTNIAKTWECSSCWVRNSEKDSKCVACEVPRVTKETGLKPSTAVTSSSSMWECSSCWVRNPMDKSKCMACESARSSEKGTSVLPNPKTQEKIAVSNAPSTWECSSCWVRNPIKEKKCLACETLHPSKDATSGLKDANGFKFSSPIHNSPITFKFGNFVCTVQSTNTTSSLKFGTATNTSSETTTATSGFKFGVPLNSGTSAVTTTTSNFKFGLPLTSVDNSSQAVTTSAGFKFGVPLSSAAGTMSSAVTTTTNSFNAPLSSAASTPSLVATTVSSIFGAPSNTSGLFCSSTASTVSNKASDVSSSNSTGFKAPSIPFGFSKNKQTEQSSVSETALSDSKLSCTKQTKTVEISSESSKRSCQHSVTDSVITSNAPETTISKEKEAAPPSVTACFGFTTQPVLDSKKSSSGFSVETTKEKASSNILPFTSNVFPVSTTSKDKISEDRKSVLSESKDNTFGAENKLSPAFQLTSQSQSVSSAFSLPSTAAPVLKFGEKTDSSKTNASSTTVALTTTTTSTFSFSNNSSNFGSITSAKASEIPSISSGLQPAVKAEDAKIPTSTTSAVFAFGNSAVTTSATSAFSFFPSSSASSTPASSVFTFGASSNAATSKPGGFTFKTLDKTQNAQTLSSSASTAQGLNIGVSASAPSGGFVFGAPKTEAQNAASTPFVFGSGPTSSANTTAFSAFQPPSQPANPTPTFQFGSQPSASTAPTFGSSNTFTFGKSEASNQISSSLSQNPASAFGSSTSGNFAFGQKNETPNQIPSTVSQAPTLAFGSTSSTFSFSNKNENSNAVSQNPAPVFGSSTIQATFGNTSVPSFGGSDKPASGGFNFGVPTSGVFQFGVSNPEKKPAVQPAGFSFGTPAATENNSFSTGFNMNTPPSFNFGATSTPTAPFQFAASSTFESTSGQSAAPRKYRKAVRRVIRKD